MARGDTKRRIQAIRADRDNRDRQLTPNAVFSCFRNVERPRKGTETRDNNTGKYDSAAQAAVSAHYRRKSAATVRSAVRTEAFSGRSKHAGMVELTVKGRESALSHRYPSHGAETALIDATLQVVQLYLSESKGK